MCGVVHTFREGIGDTRLEVARLEAVLLHFFTHCGHAMDQGTVEEKDRAIGEGDVSYLAKGGYGNLLGREASELPCLSEEVVKVTVFWFEVCH